MIRINSLGIKTKHIETLKTSQCLLLHDENFE